MKTIHTLIPCPSPCYRFAQPVEKIAFFDIETTGLSPKASSLYLIGAMCYDSNQNNWSLVQWFADDYRSEADILHAFLEFLKPFEALYHFNGAVFDVPYVLSKCEKHQIALSSHCLDLLQNTAPHQMIPTDRAVSIDLLKSIRPLKKKLHLSNANQTALEKWLGILRRDQYNGRQLITIYTEYMQKKILHAQEASELEALLLLHNQEDMSGMLAISGMLAYLDCLHPEVPPVIQNAAQQQDRLVISFELASPVPRQISLEHSFGTSGERPQGSEMVLPCASLTLQENTGVLSVPIFRGTLKYFFAPYKDYYYLPREDYAIHKSVAQFVDPAFRQKATAATCYTKKEGTFLPAFSQKTTAQDLPRFYHAYKTKPACYLLEDILPEDPAVPRFQQLSQYLFCELPHL